jgi:uncharacterized BrkB/YihY/UPF0761 family membrane protein
MNIIEKNVRRIDTYQRSRKKVSFLYGVVKKYSEDEAGYQAALMAYYGFLSLFPLLLVLTTVIKLTLRNESELRRSIIDSVTNYFPMVGNDLQKSVHSMGGTGLVLLIGILVTLYGARGVADVFRSTVNHIWEVPYVRRTGFPWSLLRSVRIIVVGGAGLVLAPIISGYAAAAGHGPLFWFSSLLITLLVLFSVFLYLLHTSLPHELSKILSSDPKLPNLGLNVPTIRHHSQGYASSPWAHFVSKLGNFALQERPWIDSRKRAVHSLWPSALMAAVGLQILQSLGSLLITHQLKHLDDLYGTFAIVLGLLFWLYLQAQVIVYALEAGTVKAFKLYPRSLILDRPTEADKQAYRLYTERNRFHDDTDDAVKKSSSDKWL